MPCLVECPRIYFSGSGPPPFPTSDDEDVFDFDLQMLGMDIIDPEFQDVVGKDPDEPWGKNLWLFNIREDPNEGNHICSLSGSFLAWPRQENQPFILAFVLLNTACVQ